MARKVVFIFLLAVLYCPGDAGAHNPVTPNLNFPSGKAVSINGIVDESAEWNDATYITFTQGSQTIQMWSKFDVTSSYLLLAFRISDNTQNSANDRITLYFDNDNDGSANTDWGMGQDRTGTLYEYRDLSPSNVPGYWISAIVDFISYYEMEFAVEIKSAQYRFLPGIDPMGPGLLVEFWDNGSIYYYPLTGGPRTDYGTYTDCYSPDLWLDKPTPTPSRTR
ncbi:hypothetical protein JW933_02115, partial [candidate division FCPU426 bacterium]|nr:hypothetical protein [candidate division FCPU426 bacterium]